MFERFRRDLSRYFAQESADGRPSALEKLRILALNPQIRAVAVYRFGRWVNDHVPAGALRVPLRLAYHLAQQTTQAFTGIYIDDGADIGGGLYLAHAGSITIGPVVMGDDCNVSIHVVMGRRTDGRGPDGDSGVPRLGDRVFVGTGAVLFGPVHVGSGATIAPLTVVGRNVAPRSLVHGNPMAVLKKDWDNTRQIYGETPAAGAEVSR